MMKLLAHILILICYGCLLLPQPTHTLRIKRSDSLANATNSNNLKANQANSVLPTLTKALGTAELAGADKPQVKIAGPAEAAVVATTNSTGTTVAEAAAAADVATAATAAAAGSTEPVKNMGQLDEAQSNELAARMHRGKRRMSLIDESLLPKTLHHGRHHATAGGVGGANAVANAAAAATAAAPPFVYYNKMVSPDGKQELKEFQLMSPNMVIESVQHDMNYGPAADMGGGVLLLNAENNLNGRIRTMTKPKHHHKHKSLALPPFLFLLQQMLQPNMNLDLETMPQTQRNRLEAPLYQFLDSAVDNALRNNHEVFEHLVSDHELDLSDNNKEKDKDRDNLELKSDKPKEAIELAANRKEDELVVSCPIHHEHHASNNGEMVDDDVVLVNECHIV
ncbi:uncharacterized protein [Drosophila virilis]|uniref:Uncharacterized protein, isoform A n=1 Tax=Drosophila virilis TaxID=7244 RepID=B4LN07_DROVI|nr:uncharacterized protein LOC6626670 [Drosophila virilis]XP_015029037.1 uncharacterized protein LOC6626670 [Drosophila virilis]EDW62122.1 uncharacterized protein Dvir_GJ19927, isoform A [Drosophila virilis]KRF80455.1 uncharacterized protein Dvir_GJ19927, isoform B [Drosophila virilis]